MKTTRLLMYALCAGVLLFNVACSDDKGVNPNNPDTDDYTDSKLTPDEHKAKIESIGKDFVLKFKSQENEKIAKALYDLDEMIHDSNFDELFDDDEEYSYAFSSLAKVILKNDISALTKVASDVEKYELSKYTGIFTCKKDRTDGYVWTKMEADHKMQLNFRSETAGEDCIFTMIYSGERIYKKVDGYEIEVPAKVNANLKVGNEEVLNLAVDINLNNEQTAATANVNLTVSKDYVWSVKTNVSGESATVNYDMNIHGEKVMSASAEVTGTKMTDPDYIENNENALNRVFTEGEFSYQILDLLIQGKGDIAAMISAYDKLDYDYNWGDEVASKKCADREAQIFNDYAKVAMYYVGKKEKVADVKMTIDFDEEYYWSNGDRVEFKDYYSVPALVFASDDSFILLEDYFTETRFSSLIDATEKLINEFADILDLEHVEL